MLKLAPPGSSRLGSGSKTSRRTLRGARLVSGPGGLQLRRQRGLDGPLHPAQQLLVRGVLEIERPGLWGSKPRKPLVNMDMGQN